MFLQLVCFKGSQIVLFLRSNGIFFSKTALIETQAGLIRAVFNVIGQKCFDNSIAFVSTSFPVLEHGTIMHTLKPFDVVVGLKIGANERRLRKGTASGLPNSSNSVGDLAEALFKGKGELSRSMNRLVSLGLISERAARPEDLATSNRRYYSLNRSAMLDFLVSGIRHVFQPEKQGLGRGIPTAWNCPLINSEMNPPEVPLVWAMPGGDAQGEVIEALYAQCAQAVQLDEELYGLLALVDVVRTGKPRELHYAKEMLKGRVMELHA